MTYLRCPFCDRLAFLRQDGECAECGYTGRCDYCREPVDPTFAPYPSMCGSDDCDAEHRADVGALERAVAAQMARLLQERF